MGSDKRDTMERQYAELKERHDAELAAAESQFADMPFGWAEHEMIFDDQGRPVDYVFLRANAAFERFTGMEVKKIIGQRVTAVIPGVEKTDPNPIDMYGQVVTSGEQQVFEFYFAPLGRWYHVTAFRHRPGQFATLFEDITDRKNTEVALGERIKELHCLQDLGKIIESETKHIDRILERAVALLPVSWMHEDVAVARIRLDEREVETGGVDGCVAMQTAPITIDGQVRGEVAVGYREARPDQDEGPFLKEERDLIDAVAERLGHAIERIAFQTTLDRERDTLKAIFDGIEDVIYVADPETYELLHVNRAFEKTWGGDVLGKKCYRILQGRDDPCPFCTNDKIFGEYADRAYTWEFQNEATGRWFRCLDKAIRWLDERPVRFEIATDITERKEMEQRMAEEERKVRTFLDNTEDLITVVNPDGRFRYVNKAAKQIFEKEPEALIGQMAFDAIHPDDQQATQEAFAGWLADRVEHATWENRQVSTSGQVFHLAWKIMPRWVDGELDSIWSIAHDVTEQRLAAEELRKSEERFRRIAEVSPDMIYCMNLPEGTYDYVSPAAESLFGYAAQDFIDNPLLIQKVIHPDWHAYFQTEWENLMADQAPPTYEYQIVHKSGETRWMNQRNVIIRDGAGAPVAIWGMVTDITPAKEAEAQLLEHQEHLEDKVAERTAELDRQSRIAQSINRIFRDALVRDSEEEVAKTALQVAEELTGAKFGFIGLINEAGQLDTIGLSNPGWDACKIPGSDATALICGMPVRGIWGEVIRNGQSLIANQPAAHPARVGTPEGHPPLTSFLGVPFRREDKTVGMIALGNKENGFDADDQAAIEALAAPFYEALLRKGMERQIRDQARIKTGQTALAERMAGDQTTEVLCRNIVSLLCTWLELPTGLIYLAGEDGGFHLAAGYAHGSTEALQRSFELGEGLVGQAARDQKVLHLDEVPENSLTIASGLGEIKPRSILAAPIVHNGRVKAVLELGSLGPMEEAVSTFLETVSDSIALGLDSARARETQARLLEEAQRMSEELQAQQEELRAANEELEEHTQRLQQSEGLLKSQQEELQVTNEELEEKNELLERQKREVEGARQVIEEKAEELALASKYKSEFLANMSHELRTPLNSLLLLARTLVDNPEGNLTPDQVESAGVIYQGGNDLLRLINEILDLSKIEAGRLDLHPGPVILTDLADALTTAFAPMAKESGLDLRVEVNDGLPAQITSDPQRLEQIIRNLAANAIKFTEQGQVQIRFAPPAPDADLRRSGLAPARAISIQVSDTGIGIAEEHQRVIFEAFQQVDGGTARRFGGTGLGLSIVRELVAILGGEIQLQSQVGQGSTFTVFLPLTISDHSAGQSQPAATPEDGAEDGPKAAPQPPARLAPAMQREDDRANITRGDRVMLIVEDDAAFAAVLAKQCREQDFRILSAATGEEGIELARRFLPQGILLDLKLPGMDGWKVLDVIKGDPQTRHIPVHIASADAPTGQALRKGAVGYLQKPISREDIAAALSRIDSMISDRAKRVLVIEDDPQIRRGIIELIADEDVRVDPVEGGQQALAALRQKKSYDCMILDLGLKDLDGLELLRQIEADPDIAPPPVIVYTARDLSWEQNLALRSYSDSIIIKDARSDERLLDEVTLFLHRVVSELPEKKRQVITNLHDTNALLRNKRVLVVDDDMRTLFALSRILSDRGMQVTKADNGQRALEVLEQKPEVDVVLMDIMMPVLDGFATMRKIRAQARFAKLPIIALTAKAMKGDQERCLEAGASDYLAKPIDQDRLLSMLRVWLYR